MIADIKRQIEISPVRVSELQRVDFLPPHFTTVEIPTSLSFKVLIDWCYVNISGRFYVGKKVLPGPNHMQIQMPCAGFEDSADATYFSLMINSIGHE